MEAEVQMNGPWMRRQRELNSGLLMPKPLLLLHPAATLLALSPESCLSWPEAVCWLGPEWKYWNGRITEALKFRI